MEFQFDDGGRLATGKFRGRASDCVTRAIAIALQLPYAEVYDQINDLARDERVTKRMKGRRSSASGGVHRKLYEKYLATLGWRWVPTMGIGTGCTTHLKADELPGGRIIARVSGHLSAVVDGVLHDTYDTSRGGTRCVYGYYQKESTA